MSYTLRQQLVIAAGGLVILLLIANLARRQLMSLRYSLGWSLIAVIGLVGALFTRAAGPLGHLVGMSPTGVFLAGATVVLGAIAIQLSITASGLLQQVRELAEAHALLASRVEELEHSRSAT